MSQHQSLRISIIVPNYNGGKTISRCLESLISQDYKDLEIIVVDGGSTDDSVSIIKRYADRITWWTSEKDRGQSHAINKGFLHATGTIVNWLCSDDFLLPNALTVVATEFLLDPATDVLAGGGELIRPGLPLHVFAPTPHQIQLMPCHNPILQPACFFRRNLLCRSPPIDESFHFAMDFELWNYFLWDMHARFKCIPTKLAIFPMEGSNKTSTGGQQIISEIQRIYERYENEFIPLIFWHRHIRAPLERLRKHHGMAGHLIARPLQIILLLLLSPFYGFDRVRAMNWSSFQ